MLDLHRHTEYSSFDGYGKPRDIAEYAKSLGYTSLGISDHGNTNGLIQQYYGCKEAGVKPVLGVEAYFLPEYQPKTKGYHLCLFAKNVEGYGNINKLQTIGQKQKYIKPIVTFKDLKKYNKGIICTTACISSYTSRCIMNDDIETAERALINFQQIFGDDFYIEIQPYRCDDNYTQETINIELINLADKLGIKCVLTSDSHYDRKEDFESYKTMRKMNKAFKYDEIEITNTYSERYLPKPKELARRFIQMHSDSFGYSHIAKEKALSYIQNLKEIEDKVDGEIIEKLEEKLPIFDVPKGYKNNLHYITEQIKKGLQRYNKWNKEYATRAKEELMVIHEQGYVDYFLMVADYVIYAKSKGYRVGPGRGSACNSIVCYALGITEVDSILHKLDFNRFMRRGKKKMPDIDVDFETGGKAPVIQYIVDKYKGHSAQIASYGLWKRDVLLNEMSKLYSDLDQATLKNIKTLIKKYESADEIDFVGLLNNKEARRYNVYYDNIITHYTKLYGKVKYIGTHAAGVAITGNPIEEYTALRIDTKTGKIFTSYDLVDVERAGMIKFDILGLKTMTIFKEIQELVNDSFKQEYINHPRIIKAFREGYTDGVFQFEKDTPKRILADIECDCFDDIVAVNAINRPAMLNLAMDNQYKEAKLYGKVDKQSPYYKYVSETYGCIIYQEQVLRLAVNIGGFTEDEADILVKMEHGASSRTKKELDEKYYDEFMKKFVTNAMKKNIKKTEALELFKACAQYGFNKGHATAYSMIAMEEMYYKLKYPLEYWTIKIKHTDLEKHNAKFKILAVQSGGLVFLPHVNYGARTNVRVVEGEKVIQSGLTEIKGIGEKAAEYIEKECAKNGPFTSVDNFLERCKNRAVTSRVVDILKEQGALEFDESIYLLKTQKYNTALYSRGIN